jgi:hypothetical protein
MSNAFPRWLEIIDRSFLSDDFKVQYTSILTERMRRMNQ